MSPELKARRTSEFSDFGLIHSTFKPRRNAVKHAGLTALTVAATLTTTSFAQTVPSASAATHAEAAAATQLDSLVVTGKVEDPLAAPEAALAEIPGGTAVIDPAQVEKGRTASTADLLTRQAGVFAQQAGGNDSIKISIRGSGINRGTGFFRSGVLFTYDGLPITGPSGTPYELFEPLGLQYTEVLRGGNAFDRGALALGGAINYATNTGYTSLPIELRGEYGSFGYYKGQIASGGAYGNADYYLSVIGSARQGFQYHSEGKTLRIISNFGYKITPDIETRFFFRYGYTNNQSPGTLTRAQIEEDPSQANPLNVLLDNHRIQPGSVWIANKTTFNIDKNSSLELGVVYHNFPIQILGGTAPSIWAYSSIGGDIKYSRTDEIFGKPSNTLVALYSNTDVDSNVVRYAGREGLFNYAVAPTAPGYAPLFLNKGDILTINNFGGSSDNVLLATNDSEILPNLWLTTGIAGTFIRRHITIDYPVTVEYDKQHFNYEPRVGLRYDITPDIQLFGNLTRTVEPRNDWSGVNTPQTSPGWFVRDLKEQTAWTTEFGTRFHAWIFDGALSYYYSNIKNELLTVIPDPTVNVSVEANASPTAHQGVEAALSTTLWQEKEAASETQPGGTDKDGKSITVVARETTAPRGPHRILLTQAYTWSNFYYKDDPVFGHNELPGIPEHYYQGELRYEHPSGFYLSVTGQYASSYNVDYANSFQTESYFIWGGTIGYASLKQGWQAYVDFRNISDKHYAADTSPGYNDHGQDIARSDPGDGFGVFGGVSWKY